MDFPQAMIATIWRIPFLFFFFACLVQGSPVPTSNSLDYPQINRTIAVGEIVRLKLPEATLPGDFPDWMKQYDTSLTGIPQPTDVGRYSIPIYNGTEIVLIYKVRVHYETIIKCDKRITGYFTYFGAAPTLDSRLMASRVIKGRYLHYFEESSVRIYPFLEDMDVSFDKHDFNATYMVVWATCIDHVDNNRLMGDLMELKRFCHVRIVTENHYVELLKKVEDYGKRHSKTPGFFGLFPLLLKSSKDMPSNFTQSLSGPLRNILEMRGKITPSSLAGSQEKGPFSFLSQFFLKESPKNKTHAVYSGTNKWNPYKNMRPIAGWDGLVEGETFNVGVKFIVNDEGVPTQSSSSSTTDGMIESGSHMKEQESKQEGEIKSNGMNESGGYTENNEQKSKKEEDISSSGENTDIDGKLQSVVEKKLFVGEVFELSVGEDLDTLEGIPQWMGYDEGMLVGIPEYGDSGFYEIKITTVHNTTTLYQIKVIHEFENRCGKNSTLFFEVQFNLEPTLANKMYAVKSVEKFNQLRGLAATLRVYTVEQSEYDKREAERDQDKMTPQFTVNVEEECNDSGSGFTPTIPTTVTATAETIVLRAIQNQSPLDFDSFEDINVPVTPTITTTPVTTMMITSEPASIISTAETTSVPTTPTASETTISTEAITATTIALVTASSPVTTTTTSAKLTSETLEYLDDFLNITLPSVTPTATTIVDTETMENDPASNLTLIEAISVTVTPTITTASTPVTVSTATTSVSTSDKVSELLNEAFNTTMVSENMNMTTTDATEYDQAETFTVTSNSSTPASSQTSTTASSPSPTTTTTTTTTVLIMESTPVSPTTMAVPMTSEATELLDKALNTTSISMTLTGTAIAPTEVLETNSTVSNETAIVATALEATITSEIPSTTFFSVNSTTTATSVSTSTTAPSSAPNLATSKQPFLLQMVSTTAAPLQPNEAHLGNNETNKELVVEHTFSVGHVVQLLLPDGFLLPEDIPYWIEIVNGTLYGIPDINNVGDYTFKILTNNSTTSYHIIVIGRETLDPCSGNHSIFFDVFSTADATLENKMQAIKKLKAIAPEIGEDLRVYSVEEGNSNRVLMDNQKTVSNATFMLVWRMGCGDFDKATQKTDKLYGKGIRHNLTRLNRGKYKKIDNSPAVL